MDPLTLHIVAPGLLDRTRHWAQDYPRFPRFTGVEAITARSQRQRAPAIGVDATLCALFGLAAEPDRDLPLGALRRYGYSGDRDGSFWVCADPAHLSAGISQVFLRDSSSLNITPAEANELGGLIVAHFADMRWALEIASPAHWHLRLPAPVKIHTYPQRLVMGRAIEAYLPSGDEASSWRALLNEMQMLFHSADVNRARQSRGDAPINGLWISGAGVLPAAGAVETKVKTVWSDDPMVIGLSRLAGIEIRPTPLSFGVILASQRRGDHLVVLESMLAPAHYDNFFAWRDALGDLENAWFKPIYEAITTGALRQCNLYDCAGQRFSLDRVRRWRMWLGVKPLHAHVGAI